MEFTSFDTALTQLGQSITTNAHGARSHLSQLADLQAELDRLKVEAKAKADELREQGKQSIIFQNTTED